MGYFAKVKQLVTNPYDRKEDEGFEVTVQLKGYGRKQEAYDLKEKINKFLDEEVNV